MFGLNINIRDHGGVSPFIRKIPGVRYLYRTIRLIYYMAKTGSYKFLHFAPPGHYYSPIPDFNEIRNSTDARFDQDTKDCPGIDLREKEQLDLLDRFSLYYGDLPFPEKTDDPARYYYENGSYGYGDAIVLYSFLRHFKPRNVIEVGSGFSSKVMLETSRQFLSDSVHFTFIEPNPERLFALLNPEEKRKHDIVKKLAQEVPRELFEGIEENDVLFIDSSHTVRFGSDMARFIHCILPALNPGVIIHFHDIMWPFEYPKQWLLEGRAWNEAYFLRAFLMYNKTFEILFFNSYLAKFHSNIIKEKMPLWLKNRGGSIWIRKTA